MADRHRVGWNATWDATAWTKWSLVQGGAWWEAVPTSADDVYFDNGANTVTLSGTRACKTINFTGFSTGIFDWTATPSLGIYWDSTFISTMSIGAWFSTLGRNFYTNNAILTSAGISFPFGIRMFAMWTLTLAWDINLTWTSGIWWGGNANLDTAWYNITTLASFGQWNYTKTVTLGDSIITCALFDLWSWTVTLNADTSTIKTSGNFVWRNLIYNNVEINWTSLVSWNNTIASLSINKNWAQTITFTDWTDQNLTTLTCVGDPTKIKTLKGSSTWWRKLSATSWILQVSFADISYCTAEWWALFYANESKNKVGNSWWIWNNTKFNFW